MKKFTEKAFQPLDQEEKELMESIENDEWQTVKNFNQELYEVPALYLPRNRNSLIMEFPTINSSESNKKNNQKSGGKK